MLVIVPTNLSNELYRKIDQQLDMLPQLKHERENIYSNLLAYYNEHGAIPDFKIVPK